MILSFRWSLLFCVVCGSAKATCAVMLFFGAGGMGETLTRVSSLDTFVLIDDGSLKADSHRIKLTILKPVPIMRI
ncbi:hypothetical protein [Desulfosporosinus sp.]|uniref:hypothetical protein n=1 Tax=Desulfosporosinus sp. TaxID=157907 RepID=UPI0025C6BCAD|nr:hypothetical protein [Desulfosporosinus sp.]MBC2724724.1 hypothetical protein [Desulfosporosinus sp.]MBC2725782.1 hypothetical protein [Desulfosporosinus sp.]